MKNKKFDKVDYDQVVSYLEDYFASRNIVYKHDSSCQCSKCCIYTKSEVEDLMVYCLLFGASIVVFIYLLFI